MLPKCNIFVAAIRSGDYYMFEDPDEELDLITEQDTERSLDSDEEESRRGGGITVSKVHVQLKTPSLLNSD